MADNQQITEAKAPFNIPSIETECETYYKIFGDLESGRPPVIVLHGGPGSGHNYMVAFRDLWYRFGLPVILYDQIGTGKSTHLRDKKLDYSFWTMDLMVQQLESLIDHLQFAKTGGPGYHILGHSYGGMVSAYFATRRPRGLQRLVLASAIGSVDLHIHGLELCCKTLSEEIQQAFQEALETKDWKKQSYTDALMSLNKVYWCRADPSLEELKQTRQNHMDDDTVLETMWGKAPSEVTGSLKGWNCFSELQKIDVPTLLYRGEWDLTRDEVVAPYVEQVPGVRKVVIEKASHMSHLDNEDCRERVMSLVGGFLTED